MALHRALPAWTVILMVPVCPESGFRRVTPSRGPFAKWHSCRPDDMVVAFMSLASLSEARRADISGLVSITNTVMLTASEP